MIPEWLIWYGLKIGLSYAETLDTPYGELLSLIAAEQIKHEDYSPKYTTSDEDVIPDIR